MTKQNIVFLFSGQARTFPFSIKNEIHKKKRSIEILDCYNKYIFTDEFKSKYNYQVLLQLMTFTYQIQLIIFQKKISGIFIY